MPVTPEDLKRRLERADALRRKLRRATLELRELGRRVRHERSDGPGRPGRGRTRDR